MASFSAAREATKSLDETSHFDSSHCLLASAPTIGERQLRSMLTSMGMRRNFVDSVVMHALGSRRGRLDFDQLAEGVASIAWGLDVTSEAAVEASFRAKTRVRKRTSSSTPASVSEAVLSASADELVASPAGEKSADTNKTVLFAAAGEDGLKA